jgi:hypothetical protein
MARRPGRQPVVVVAPAFVVALPAAVVVDLPATVVTVLGVGLLLDLHAVIVDAPRTRMAPAVINRNRIVIPPCVVGERGI